MAGVGTKITAADYNAIQTKISDVMTTGTGTYGYGQAINSGQVSTSLTATVTQWNNLRADLLRARQHQTGIDESSNLTVATTSTKIIETIRAQYDTYADTVVSNRTVVPPTGQGSRITLSALTRNSSWNTSITHTVTLTFNSANEARWYFNAGGKVEFSASIPNGTTGTKNNSWYVLLTNMGTISFLLASTFASGSGTGSSIGYSSLTSSNQLVFQKTTEAPTYNPNAYNIYARYGSSAAQVIFTIQFNDSYAPGGYGIDEYVTGIVSSTVQGYYATGTNVSVAAPSVTASFP